MDLSDEKLEELGLTRETVDGLKKAYKAATDTDALRQAMARGLVAAKKADEDAANGLPPELVMGRSKRHLH